MKIEDLELTQELARAELWAIRGGSNYGYVGGQGADQGALAGGIGSPTTAINAPVNAASLTQLDNDPRTRIDVDSTTVAGSAFTVIGDWRRYPL